MQYFWDEISDKLDGATPGVSLFCSGSTVNVVSSKVSNLDMEAQLGVMLQSLVLIGCSLFACCVAPFRAEIGENFSGLNLFRGGVRISSVSGLGFGCSYFDVFLFSFPLCLVSETMK